MFELEVRLKHVYTSDLFVSFLKDFFSNNLTKKYQDTVYIIDDNIRVIKNSDDQYMKYSKDVIFVKHEKSFKFSISEERLLDNNQDDDLENNNTIRERSREVYSIYPNFELHITRINNTKWEVELETEILENNEELVNIFNTNFDNFMNSISKHYRNYNTFVYNLNPCYDKENPGQLSKYIFVQPRDFEKSDLITVDGKGLPEGFTLTIKGNGIPHLLYLNDKTLYFGVLGKTFTLLKILNNFQGMESFIIIGEYFENSKIFAPFDILFWSRKKNIIYYPNHIERMDICNDIMERNKKYYDSHLVYYRKKFYKTGETPESFAKAYLKVKKDDYPFENDGMILTPIFRPHNTFLDPKKYNGKRQLSNNLEVCKIKPWEEQSIDFRVDTKSQKLYNSQCSEPFSGTYKYRFNSETMVDWNSIDDIYDEKIVELLPRRDSDNNVYFIFGRHREDKHEPNSKLVAEKNWTLINEPLEENLFLAKDLSRLRLQNNSVKKELIKQIPKNSVVIDIGTGRGGDIMKYNNHVSLVICVEPDEINRKELYNRLDSLKDTLTTKFIVLDCGGEDYNKIRDTYLEIKKDYPTNDTAIVSMLSLTFFWKNSEMLKLFERTLTEISKYSPKDCYFYFLTIEGNRFKKYLERNNNYIKTSALKAKYYPDEVNYGVGIRGKVKIEIPDSIVRLQIESLVNLPDLKCITELDYQTALIEDYLSTVEKEYGECHVYGKAKIK